MLYQLKPLFMGERDSLPIDCEMDFSGLEYQNAHPFQGPVRVNDYQLPLDELVEEELILNLPSKNLCRKDCRGLCPKCGKNLNEGLCGCRSDTIDPRLEVLRQLMN